MIASTVIADTNRRMGDAGNKVFDAAEKLAELKKELRWNEVYYHLARVDF